ncbi:triose-phosphate isomerase [Terriglobus tenax]|uniref:triose-phosphate isomerase n=1 Tax=Terriglobus tenax TaxID=1111115 RepID=UPI0021E050AC|nr:triose-phosphate isomerase [Terriglobus tenax]
MRKKLIAANWKMYKTPSEALNFVEAFLPLVAGHTRDEIALFPSITSLPTVIHRVRGSNVAAGAQSMHWADEGAYTGHTSATMLTAVGATHVLIGHSENRQYDNETDERINLKVKSALSHGLIPLLCVGEQKDERQCGKTEDVLVSQLAGALAGFPKEHADRLVIAYEPVWAIGTGLTATPETAEETHLMIRTHLEKHLGDVANEMRILYGGSVKPDNASALLNQPNIDGALVGGASLKPDSFAAIVKY